MLTKFKNIFKNNKFNVIFKYSFIKYIALVIGFLKEIVNARALGPELLGGFRKFIVNIKLFILC